MNYIPKALRTYNHVRESIDSGKDIRLDKNGKRQVQAISQNETMKLRASLCEFRKTVR